MQLSDYTIGVIGYGHFGKVICQYVFSDNPIVLYTSKQNIPDLPQNISVTQSLEELVKQSDIIIPAVPIRNFETIIKQLAHLIKPNQIIIECCSVKEYPVATMKNFLPDFVQIIATHPMFGPVSVEKNNNNLKGLKIVMDNITAQVSVYNELTTYFQNLGLDIITMSPQEHDQLAAKSHFFSKTLRLMADELNLHATKIDTPAATAIFEAFSKTANDKAIVEDMIVYNSYCKEVLEGMMRTLTSLKNNQQSTL